MAIRAKRFEYEVALAPDGSLTADGAARVELDERWAADHVLLASLLRCILTSLRYHADRAGVEVASAQALANGAVTKRETDGRYALVEVECRLDVALVPAPAEPGELLARAERDCFVGASLTVTPQYTWVVNGASVSTPEPD